MKEVENITLHYENLIKNFLEKIMKEVENITLHYKKKNLIKIF